MGRSLRGKSDVSGPALDVSSTGHASADTASPLARRIGRSSSTKAGRGGAGSSAFLFSSMALNKQRQAYGSAAASVCGQLVSVY